jgi:hypothetical protein
MLKNPSDGLLECLQHAEECGRRATTRPAGSPARLDYLQLEARWRALARSIEFSDRLEDLSNKSSDWPFTMEQIGRELQKIWPTGDMSPRLRELFADVAREWATAMHRNHQDPHGDRGD